MSSDFSGGPGFLAFVSTFALVVAGILLFLSLSRHLRKVRARDARDREEARLAADAGSRRDDAVAPDVASDPDSPASGSAGPGSAGLEGGDRGGDEVADEPGDR